MALALVPILAQVVTVSVGDRTELRERFEPDVRVLEAESRPAASVAISNRRAELRFIYAPLFTLTPLDSPDRELIIFHNGAIIGTNRFRRTTLTLTLAGGYGERDYRVSALSGQGTINGTTTTSGTSGTGTTPGDTGNAGGTGATPGGTGATPGGTGATPGGAGTTPGGTTGAPGAGIDTRANAVRAVTETIRFGTLRAEAAVGHTLSARSFLGGAVGYSIGGGIGRTSEAVYPVTRGPDVSFTYRHLLSPVDVLTTTARAQSLSSTDGNHYYTAGAEQGYGHAFGQHFRLGASVGIIYTRVERSDGTVVTAVYPTFGLGSGAAFEYQTRLWGGTLTLTAGAAYTPYLDTISGVLDPRVSLFTGASYVRRRLSLYANLFGTWSIRPNDDGALNAIGASAGASYDLGAGFVIDGGVRAAWQTLEGSDIIPPSYAIFIGLSWGAVVYQG